MTDSQTEHVNFETEKSRTSMTPGRLDKAQEVSTQVAYEVKAPQMWDSKKDSKKHVL